MSALVVLTLCLISIATSIFARTKPLSATPKAHLTLEPTDIRKLAPARPADFDTSDVAVPESGSDMGAIGADWARRQIHLSSRGGDEKFLNETNDKLDRFFAPFLSSNVQGEGSGHGPASEDTSWSPKSVHMSRLGELEFGFRDQLTLTCDFTGSGGPELNLSKPVATDLDLRLHHEARESLNSLQFRFGW